MVKKNSCTLFNYFGRSCQEVLLSFRTGILTRKVMDSAILLTASSLHLRTMRAVRIVSIGHGSGCSCAKCSSIGVPGFLLVPSRKCSLYRSRNGLPVSPTYVLLYITYVLGYISIRTLRFWCDIYPVAQVDMHDSAVCLKDTAGL